MYTGYTYLIFAETGHLYMSPIVSVVRVALICCQLQATAGSAYSCVGGPAACVRLLDGRLNSLCRGTGMLCRTLTEPTRFAIRDAVA